MKKIILFAILYSATIFSSSAQKTTFNSVDFANAYFKAWNKTQMPEASEKDLENYNVVEREAIQGTYRGYEVFSMPPPSSGGVHIVQILNMLENYDLAAMGHNSAQHIHTMVESMRRAYADRSLHLGDSDFVSVPVKTLTSKKYAKQLVATIDPNKATSSKDIQPDADLPYESDQTTHFSVVINGAMPQPTLIH